MENLSIESEFPFSRPNCVIKLLFCTLKCETARQKSVVARCERNIFAAKVVCCSYRTPLDSLQAEQLTFFGEGEEGGGHDLFPPDKIVFASNPIFIGTRKTNF